MTVLKLLETLVGQRVDLSSEPHDKIFTGELRSDDGNLHVEVPALGSRASTRQYFATSQVTEIGLDPHSGFWHIFAAFVTERTTPATNDTTLDLNFCSMRCLRVLNQHGHATASGISQYLDKGILSVDAILVGLGSLGYVEIHRSPKGGDERLWCLTQQGTDIL